jgi:hypothetical protein
MTPYEFGRRVKLAAETGGFGEFLGQGFDRGTGAVADAMGINIPANMWGGGSPAGAPAPAQRRVMPGVSDATPLAPPRPPQAPRVMPGVSDAVPLGPPRRQAPPRVMPGVSDAVPLAPARPAPRPAAAPTAPAQSKPTAPGVRRASGRVA